MMWGAVEAIFDKMIRKVPTAKGEYLKGEQPRGECSRHREDSKCRCKGPKWDRGRNVLE